MCSGLDHTILNVTFSVIVHTVVLHLLAVSICNLLSVSSCSFLLSKSIFKHSYLPKVNERIHDLLNLYVHGDESALHDLLDDLRLSKKWSSNFGILPNSKGDLTVHDKVLHFIVKEYKDCKNKEVNSVIRKQAKKMTQAINISGTLSKSEVAFLQVCIVLSH